MNAKLIAVLLAIKTAYNLVRLSPLMYTVVKLVLSYLAILFVMNVMSFPWFVAMLVSGFLGFLVARYIGKLARSTSIFIGVVSVLWGSGVLITAIILLIDYFRPGTANKVGAWADKQYHRVFSG